MSPAVRCFALLGGVAFSLLRPAVQPALAAAAPAQNRAAPSSLSALPAVDVANMALGGALTSRINMNLRENKHWSYGAGSGIGAALFS